ncbi:diguanylate cyclase [Rhodospirillum rubrum]|uniref:GGDEF family protein n=2 Tax=Rhodospirillum rubrum TaxID=1085 RepID=Q2RVJ5_RHORT|nr:diguanylate cyclase [Rhodospirillum rubrum]ABC21850.1 GGDEF family protein [Rhodospirillum rubrum ATCC 11170]AEO47551.1 GGDEF family protein [Rhodospirillum rubrum F11]MBK5953413.1 diguanylate cyclase [Rhodospirillum rubrum]QXG81511.1 diguanylate cyclase [Rhodospirillum rubrum]HAQ01298.1 diguanylate cyclase [Rhodospirillum rubrum]
MADEIERTQPAREPGDALRRRMDAYPPPPDHPDHGASQEDRQRGRSAYRLGASLAHPPQPIQDEASVLGLPPRLLTPRIQEAITGLMEEMERTRLRLASSQAHESVLSGLADADGVLPVLNRRAILRELDLRVRLAREGGPPFLVSLFYLTNFDALRRIAGLDAALAGLTRLAAEVLSAAGLGDGRLKADDLTEGRFPPLAGSLGGASVLLARGDEPQRPPDQLGARAEKIRLGVTDKGLRWGGVLLPLAVSAATVLADGREETGALVARLDGLLRQ